MIDVSEAFDGDTTELCYLQLPVAGYWDENNQWIEGELAPEVEIWATPIPAGDLGSAVFGESLEARKQGERTPEYMKFRSTDDMPLKSIVRYNEEHFKIVRHGDFRAGGYTLAIGSKILSET